MNTEPLEAGAFYHIYNRGNNREALFLEARNYNYFLRLWRKHISPVADTYAYCLLKNHFHFLIKTKNETAASSITQAFSNCFNAYTKSINKLTGRSGSLFQERFRRKPIASDFHLTECLFYIHANPQRHNAVADFRTYSHSSFPALCCNKPTELKREAVWDWFGGKEKFIAYCDAYQMERLPLLMDIEK